VKKTLGLLVGVSSMVYSATASGLSDHVDLYGSLRPEIIVRTLEGKDTVRRMDDGYSRISLKGSMPLNAGLEGFFKAERRISANDGEDDGAVRADNNEFRQVYAGLKGKWGAVSIGRHYGVYYDVIDDEIDRHRSHYSDALVLGDLFVSNSLVLRSAPIQMKKNLALEGTLLIEFNDTDANDEAEDERFELALGLTAEDLKVNAAYVDSPDHDGLFGLSFSWACRSDLTLAGVFQNRSVMQGGDDQLFSLALDYDFLESNALRVAGTKLQADGGVDTDTFLVGVDHRFSSYFLTYIEFFSRSSDPTQANDEDAGIFGVHINF